MNTFTVNIYTPEKCFGTFEVVSLTCSGLDGEICIMRGHMPMLLAIKTGKMKLRTEEGVRTAVTDEGTVIVENNIANVFTDICEWEDESTEDIALRIAKRREADRESIRIHRHHEIKLARTVTDKRK